MIRTVSITPHLNMKTFLLKSSALGAVLALASCAAPSGPNTQKGAVYGGLGGAALGGIIGNQSGRALEGAAIGAAAGAGGGALLGNARDQERYGY